MRAFWISVAATLGIALLAMATMQAMSITAQERFQSHSGSVRLGDH